MFLKAAVLFFALLSFSVEESSAQGPGAQWEFSRDITFSTATPLADFQVKIELNGAADHVHMKNDGSDLRFWAGAVECNYWIERFNPTGLSVIWVKVPANGTTGLTMYYGNPAANTTSNGFNTFDFFDDFEAATLDNIKWATNGNTSKGASDLTIYNSGYLSNKSPFLPIDPNTSFYLETKHKEAAYHRIRYYTTVTQGTNSYDKRPTIDYGYFSGPKNSDTASVYWNGGLGKAPFVTAGTNYITQWQIQDGSTYNWNTINYDDRNADTIKKSTTVIDKLRYITIISNEDGASSTTVDWIRVRKWNGTAPDPVAIIGTVESQTNHTITGFNTGCVGSTITINGTGFTGVNSVVFNGTPAASYTVENGGIIKAVVPADFTPGPITITRKGVNVTSATSFTAIPSPTKYSVTGGGAYCEGGAGMVVGLLNSQTGVTYQLFNGSTPKGSPVGGTGGPLNFGLQTVAGTYTIWAKPSTGECNVLMNGSVDISIRTIKAFAVTGGGQYCEESTAPSIGLKGSETGVNYQLYLGGTAVGSALPGTGSAIDFGPQSTNGNYTIKASTNAPVCNKDMIGEVTILKNEFPSGTMNWPSLTACQGTRINFTAPAGYQNYSFLLNTNPWNSNDIAVNIDSLPISAKTGDTVTIIATTSAGCSRTFISAPVTMNTIPVGALELSESSGVSGNDNKICAGDGINFAFINAPQSYTSYKYSLESDASILSTESYFTATGLTNGAQVKLEVSNNGCTNEFLSPIITVNDLPTATLSSDKTEICLEQPLTFTGSGGVSYAFLINEEIQVSAPNPFITSSLLNNAEIKVIVTDVNSCSSTSDVKKITVHPLPSQPIISPSGPLEFCEGTTPVTLTATAGASTYQWFRNNTLISGANNQSYSPANTVAGGTGIYTVIVTNANDCESVASAGVNVVVNSSAAKPTISDSPLEVCLGGSVVLTSSNASSYQWYYSSTENGTLNSISGQTNKNITLSEVAETGYYAVGITNANGCSGAALSDRKLLVINVLPVTPVISVSLGDLELCVGETVTLSAPVSTGYRWFKNNVLISGANSQTYTTVNTVEAAGTYTVQVENANNCWSAISEGKAVVVNPLPQPTIDNGNICLGTSGNEYKTESDQLNYVWSVVGDGSITSGEGTYSIIVDWANTPGTKSLNVAYQDPITKCISTSQATFTSLPPVVPVISTNQSQDFQVCAGTTVVYSTQKGVDINDYDWTFTDDGMRVNGGMADDDTITILWNGVGPQSVSVNYTKNNCNAPSPTILAITVNPVPVADFSFSATPYCSNGTNPLPTMAIGATKGTFSAPAGLSIDSETGKVNLSASIAGSYIVTNTIAATGGCAPVSSTATITITKLPTATLTYNGSPFCTSDNTLKSVTLTGTDAYSGGLFSGPAGLSVNAISGAIDPSSSTKGNYKVTYTVQSSNGCEEVVVQSPKVVITELPTVSLSYSSNEFCTSENGIKSPALTGTESYSGGTYSVSPSSGLSINTINGQFTPSTSTPGTYTITYSTPATAGCSSVIATFNVTITAVPTASISYAGTPLCKTLTSVPVTITGTGAYTGGSYSSTGGLIINPSSGVIDPSSSTAGTYTVTYTIPASGGCAAVPVTTQINITDTPTANAGADLVFCSDVTEIDIIGGVSSDFNNGTLWATSGDGAFSNAVSITNNKYTPGPNDRATGTVILTLTATGNDNCASVSDSKTITLNALPTPVVIVPANPEFCEGTIQPLTSVKEKVTDGSPVFNSGTVNVSIPDNNFTGIKNKVTVTGIPANAVINNISVKFKINHPSGKELIGNLRSPSNKELNLFYMVGNGSNFTETVISSTATNPIQTFGNSPFTGTFSSQGVMGAMGAAFSTSFSQLYTTASSLNGDWYLKLSDMVLLAGNTGTLVDWSINISYSIPVEPVAVTWSPLTDLFTDVAAEVPYAGEALATVYTKVSQSGTTTYTATNVANGAGCKNSSTVDLIVRKSPKVEIATDYCTNPGKVILTASATDSAPFTFKWNTGTPGDTVHIDEARDYYVSATNSEGCVGTAVMAIAKELVVNGDFEQGYVEGSFITNYAYVAGPGTQTGPGSLYNEGRYAIDSNANKYHANFFGKDHTTPEQKGNFMIINGYPGSSNKVIWEQTVVVEPNTRYYYSAWAMNLNAVGPFARLRFEVNGQQIGSTAELNTAPKQTNNGEINVNNWVRFYYGQEDGWYSGNATTATIRIINLEPAAGGNDFGLDDISFATLSPFIRGPLADGADQQLEVCSGTSIKPIIYQMGSGVENPLITGLPPGWKPTFDGLNYKITGSPVNNTNAPIKYDYTLTIKGCVDNDPPKVMEGTIIVHPNSKLEMTSLPENKDQSLCINLPMNAITFNTSGQISGIKHTTLPAGTSLSYNSVNGQLIISGTPSLAGEYNYLVRTEGGICSQDTIQGVIKVSPKSVAGVVSSPTACIGESGIVTLNETDQIGEVVLWQVSNDNINFTDIPNSKNATSQTFTNVSQSAFYRVKVKNEYCPDTAVSLTGKIRIYNLWEGGIDTAWAKPPNWSAGSMPTINCSNTIIIPQIPTTRKNPWIGSGNAQVTNLTILPGGHLTVDGGNLQIKGTITNNGILDAKKGGIEYNGNTAQAVSPGIFLDNAIGDLKISNSNKGLTLNAPVDIYRSVTFGSGSQKLITNDQLTLKSNKDETAWLGKVAAGQTITGKATVERFINTGTTATGGHRKSWQLLATPTQGQSIKDSWMEGATATNVNSTPGSAGNPHPGFGTMITSAVPNAANQPTPGFDVRTAPGPSMKTYNPITNTYDAGPATTTQEIYNPNGYLVLVRGDRSVYTHNAPATPTTLRTKGTLLTGTQPVLNFAQNTWNSVGNPFASAIDLNSIEINGGVKDVFAVWDPLSTGDYGLGGFTYLVKSGSNFIAVPSSPSYPGSQPIHIQSGQAFMVQTAPSQGGSIQFTENAKVSGSRVVMRGQNGDSRISQLRANLYGLDTDGSATISDGILLQFSEELSNEIDGKDARKMSNTSENLSIISNGIQLAIERRQHINSSDTIFLNLSGVRVQNYQFEFIANNLQSEGLQGFVEDTYLGQSTSLNLEGSTLVNFNIENKPGSYAANRFRIVFKAAHGPLPVTFTGINANRVKEDIAVTWNVENEINILGYDVEKSTNGTIFNKIAHLSAKNLNSYNWWDKNVEVGNHYYRVKALNIDGKTELTPIVKVQIQSEPAKITVYPNPITNGVVNVHLINQPSGNYRIRLLNPVGQAIVNKVVTHIQGNSIHPIDWDYKLARGMYQIEVTKPDGGINIIKVIY